MPRFTNLHQVLAPSRPFACTLVCSTPRLCWEITFKGKGGTLNVHGTRCEAERIADAYHFLFLSEHAQPQDLALSELDKLDLAEAVASGVYEAIVRLAP